MMLFQKRSTWRYQSTVAYTMGHSEILSCDYGGMRIKLPCLALDRVLALGACPLSVESAPSLLVLTARK